MCKHARTLTLRYHPLRSPILVAWIASSIAIFACLLPTTLQAGEDSEDIEILKAMDEAMSEQWLQQDQWLRQELQEAPAASEPRTSIHLPLFMRDTRHDPDYLLGPASTLKSHLPQPLRSQTIRSEDFDIPVAMNASVQSWIDFYTGSASRWFRIYLERSTRYVPLMRKIFREEGLPEDLVYLSMIESGFAIRARSSAAAVGPWQFLESTARMYDLKVDWWVDERLDVEKATRGAARYLKREFKRFGDWYLAIVAYNAGPGRIHRAIQKYQDRDFWRLSQYDHLAMESKLYVPKFLAALIIAKNPSRYGFRNLDYQDPIAYDSIRLEEATDLSVIAQATGFPLEKIEELNPQLKRWATPPDYTGYVIKLPQGTSEIFAEKIAQIPRKRRLTFRMHKVQPGETLGHIARKYEIPLEPIKKVNGIQDVRRIRVGMELIIPIPLGPRGRAQFDETTLTRMRSAHRREGARSHRERPRPTVRRQQPRQERPKNVAQAVRGRHKVRFGQTLWGIANEYGTTVENLRELNNLRSDNSIHPGQELIVERWIQSNRHGQDEEGKVILMRARARAGRPDPFAGQRPTARFHVIKPGETLWHIAIRYGISMEDLKRRNRIRDAGRLQVGQKLRIR